MLDADIAATSEYGPSKNNRPRRDRNRGEGDGPKCDGGSAAGRFDRVGDSAQRLLFTTKSIVPFAGCPSLPATV
jgi:hypothetical protein